MRRALITGIGGQDGSLLAELLLEKGYEVAGIARAGSETPNLEHVRGRVTVVDTDLTDRDAVEAAIRATSPDELYHLASVSFVPASWADPAAAIGAAVSAIGAVLGAVNAVSKEIRVCNASSSEVFGRASTAPQNELTPIAPVTPYGIGKASAQLLARAYRERFGLHVSSAILYNHESPRRPPSFLPRKVSLGVAAIASGRERELILGDLDARRDWGYAGDYVRGMWSMLQQDEPDDYVLATGEAHTVRELVALAFRRGGLDYEDYVRSDPALLRGGEGAASVVGDSSKARARLDWSPQTGFDELVEMLVDADMGRAS